MWILPVCIVGLSVCVSVLTDSLLVGLGGVVLLAVILFSLVTPVVRKVSGLTVSITRTLLEVLWVTILQSVLWLPSRFGSLPPLVGSGPWRVSVLSGNTIAAVVFRLRPKVQRRTWHGRSMLKCRWLLCVMAVLSLSLLVPFLAMWVSPMRSLCSSAWPLGNLVGMRLAVRVVGGVVGLMVGLAVLAGTEVAVALVGLVGVVFVVILVVWCVPGRRLYGPY